MTLTRLMTTGMAAVLLLAAGGASAAVVQWDLYGNNWDPLPAACSGTTKSANNCDLGTSASYTQSIYTIGFTGASGGQPAAIVENNRGNHDEGLGILGDNDEVNLNEYIRVDLGAAFNSLTNWMVMFDSTSDDEVSQLGTTIGDDDLATAMEPNVFNQWHSFTPTSAIMYFTTAGPSGSDTLLKALKAETRAVPEPGTIALLGLALAGFGVSRRRAAARLR